MSLCLIEGPSRTTVERRTGQRGFNAGCTSTPIGALVSHRRLPGCQALVGLRDQYSNEHNEAAITLSLSLSLLVGLSACPSACRPSERAANERHTHTHEAAGRPQRLISRPAGQSSERASGHFAGLIFVFSCSPLFALVRLPRSSARSLALIRIESERTKLAGQSGTPLSGERARRTITSNYSQASKQASANYKATVPLPPSLARSLPVCSATIDFSPPPPPFGQSDGASTRRSRQESERELLI